MGLNNVTSVIFRQVFSLVQLVKLLYFNCISSVWLLQHFVSGTYVWYFFAVLL